MLQTIDIILGDGDDESDIICNVNVERVAFILEANRDVERMNLVNCSVENFLQFIRDIECQAIADYVGLLAKKGDESCP